MKTLDFTPVHYRYSGSPSAPRGLRFIAGAALLCIVSALCGCETVGDTVRETADAISPPSKPVPKEVDLIKKEPDIRVRILRGTREVRVTGPQRFVARPVANSRSANPAKPLVFAAPLTISSSNRGVQVSDAAGKKSEWGFGVDVEVLASDGTTSGTAETPGESIRVNGRALPGYLTVRPAWSENAANFDVTASMPVETYVPGVLSNELYKDWPRQAFEAQAVASRTYALEERQRARTEGKFADVEDSTSDQVFGGTSTLPVAIEAARATRGWVLTEKGQLIRAYFSSQCGGRAASAADAWSARGAQGFNLAASLQGRPRQTYCQRSPLYRWTVTRSSEDFNKRLRAWGRAKGNDLGSLSRARAITVKTHNEALRPSSYTITSDSGHEYTLAAEELREAGNWAAPGLTPITVANRLNSGDVEISIFANEVRIRGRGYGHGVGLCQWCAKGMADAGLDWRSMIEQFYPGVEVRKLY